MLYRFAHCTLNTQLHTLCRAGRSAVLSPKVFEVLCYLMTHRERVVSKQELCDNVWQGLAISDATLESCIRAVRTSVGDSGQAQQIIQTQRGYGYRFVAAVEMLSDASPSDAAAMASLAELDPQASAQAQLQMAPAPPSSLRQSGGATESLLPGMRPCGVCARANQPDATFCAACGARLRQRCAYCGQDVALPAVFCVACGQPLASLPPPDPATLAAQFEHWRQAGEQAVSGAAYQEAVTCFEQALQVLQDLPTHPDTPRQEIALRFHLSHALMMLGEFGRARDALRHAQILAESLEDGRQLRRACTLLTTVDWVLGNYQGALALGRRAIAIAHILGDFVPQVHTTLLLGQVALAMGDYQRAQGYFRRNIACLDGELQQQSLDLAELPGVLSRAWLAWCLAEVGAFAEGTAYGEEGVQSAEAADHPLSLAVACYGVGLVYLYQGDVSKATARFERSLALCQGESLLPWFPLIAAGLGLAYARGGRAAAAVLLLKQAIERAAGQDFMGYQALRLTWLGEAYLVAGRLDEAYQSAERALQLAHDHHEHGSQARALHLLGAIATHREPPHLEAAEAVYKQALALAEALGMQPLVAHCHLGLSALYRRCGRLTLANTEFTAARILLRTLDMPYGQQQVAGES